MTRAVRSRGSEDRPVIALLTDFGSKDGNVAVMKGVILSIAPQVQLVDLSHDVGPQDVREAAWILGRSAPYFPAGTIHLVVVDPGVGTERRPMAARLGSQRFVGPDNGVATRLIDRAEKEDQPRGFFRLDRPVYWLPEVSRVFHGRDLFAPVAAHLAGGVPLEEVGTVFGDPVRLPLVTAQVFEKGVRGSVEYIDRFGNVRTNITREDLGEHRSLTVEIAGARLGPLAETFGDRPEGELVALVGSTGDLIVSVVNGSAADRLGSRVGDPVEARWETAGG
jgi:S-adenosylmethionine hydrolase